MNYKNLINASLFYMGPPLLKAPPPPPQIDGTSKNWKV